MGTAAERIAIEINSTADTSGFKQTRDEVALFNRAFAENTTALRSNTDAVRAAADAVARFRAQSQTGLRALQSDVQGINTAMEGLSHSAVIGLSELSRGVAKVAQAGELGAFAMREFTGAAFRLGEFLGPAGEFLPIIGLVGFALYEAFKGGEDESAKMRKQFEEDVNKMVDAVDQSGLEKKLRALEIGDPSKGVGQGGGYRGSIRDLVAQINDIAGQYDRLANLIDEGTGKKVSEQDTWIGRATRLQLAALQHGYDALEAKLKDLRGQQGTLYEDLLNPAVLPGMQRDPKGLAPTTIKADTSEAAARKMADALKKSWESAAFFAAHDLENNQVFGKVIQAVLSSLARESSIESTTGKQAREILSKQLVDMLNAAVNDAEKTLKSAGGDALKNFDAFVAASPIFSAAFWRKIHSPLRDEAHKAAQQLGDYVAQEFGMAIGHGLSTAFEQGFAEGGKGFLGGLGSIFEQIGESAIAGMAFMQGISDAIASFAPAIGIPIAIGLVALGAEMKRMASSAASAGHAGGAGGGYSPSTFTPTPGFATGGETQHITIIMTDPEAPGAVRRSIALQRRAGELKQPIYLPGYMQ